MLSFMCAKSFPWCIVCDARGFEKGGYGVPLAQALAEFERYGDTGLVVRDPAIAALKVHGSFELQQVGGLDWIWPGSLFRPEPDPDP